ncbi:MAG: dienelactone hydrolase family protein [Frankiaceae bacterium]
MTHQARIQAPAGDLGTFDRERFVHEDVAHDFYRKGRGPAVLVITEIPGITPLVLGFADRVVALGCTAVLPDLFGTAGRDPLSGGKLAGLLYGVRSFIQVCISREFVLFATGRTSPVVAWLRALAAAEHQRCGGPGVGVVGLCFSGGFGLAMAVDPRVLAPVLAQPSLPCAVTRSRRRAIDCSPADLDVVARRCNREGLRVLGLRFNGDPFVPAERFAFLQERLGDGFIAVELDRADGNPDGPLPWRHSVLTSDLVDEQGAPTRAALDRVLELLRDRLLAP